MVHWYSTKKIKIGAGYNLTTSTRMDLHEILDSSEFHGLKPSHKEIRRSFLLMSLFLLIKPSWCLHPTYYSSTNSMLDSNWTPDHDKHADSRTLHSRTIKWLTVGWYSANSLPGIFTQNNHLVGGFNLSEKYESQLGSLFPIYGNTVPNHQPDHDYKYIHIL